MINEQSVNGPMRISDNHRKQQGAALIVGLVLLLVLTVLGISGMNMATLELQMANNTQAAQLAFQAAETGIDIALSGNVSTAAPTTIPTRTLGDGSYEVDGSIFCAATTRVPEGIYSEDNTARAVHFDAVVTGRGPRNAVSRHSQSVYIVGPAPGSSRFDPTVSPGSC